MLLNRIQVKIFGQLSEKHEMTPDEYIQAFSEKILSKKVSCLAELSEEDGDAWITKAYLQSL